jgi:hypothetical protein
MLMLFFSQADRASIVADAIDYVKELKRTVQELQLLVQEKRRTRGLGGGGGGGHHGAGVRGLDCKRRRIMKSATDQAAVLVGSDGTAAIPGSMPSCCSAGYDNMVQEGDEQQPMDTTTNTTTSTTSASNNMLGCCNHSMVMQKLGNVDSFSVDAGTHLRSSWLQRTSHNGTHVDVRIVHDEVTIKISQRRRRNCLMDVIVALQELRLDLLQASGANIGEHDVFFFNTKVGTTTTVPPDLIVLVNFREFCDLIRWNVHSY